MKKVITSIMLLSCMSTMASTVDVNLVKKFSRGQDVVSNIYDLNELNINNFNLTQQPWTSTYLPAIRGFAADPYAGSGSNILFFKRNRNKYERSMEKFQEGRMTLDAETIASLSSADKYDLLVGNFKSPTSLAKRLFEQADFLHERFGKLTFWTGMCHGWSPAAISHPAPLRTVEVVSADGQYVIPFYPNDIKSLLSTAFANNIKAYVDDARIQTSGDPNEWSKDNIMPIHGYACRQKRPRVDETGRVRVRETDINEDLSNCEDVNAGFWHLTVMNLMGRHQQGLVVDIDHNEKVNNHPTAGYEIRYFNLDSGMVKRSFRDALIDIDLYKEDDRKEFRDPRAKYVVGVEMNMIFVDYKFLNKKNAQDVDMQKLKERKFLYDLELDKDGNIVGGEWINKTVTRRQGRRIVERKQAGDKPDFLWYAPRGMKPVAFQEAKATGTWHEGAPLPASWAQTAISASYEMNLDYTSDMDENGRYPFRPQPEVVFSIIEKLLEFSRN
mgnify:CR=1 FL=1